MTPSNVKKSHFFLGKYNTNFALLSQVTCDITGPDGSPVESIVAPIGEKENEGPFNVS